jgi:hypothetical protein
MEMYSRIAEKDMSQKAGLREWQTSCFHMQRKGSRERRAMGVHNIEHYPEIRRLLEIPPGEPIFIIRAQDDIAVDILNVYTSLQMRPGGYDERWVQDLKDTVSVFENWQLDNPTKVKRAD